jgi:hypothetical protein
MNIKNSKIDFENQKKFWKRLAVTTMLTAITCGYFENAAAELNANVSAMFREAIDLPLLINAHTTPPTAEELITCNVHLANILANAIVKPLAFLISNGGADPVPAIERVAAFVAAPTPRGAQPREGVAGAWGNVPQHIIDAKIAVAVLIVASAKAAKAAGTGAPGLNASAIRAAAVYDAFSKETSDAPFSNADTIVAAYLGVPGVAAVPAARRLPADDHGGPAKKLWDYMIGYARLWKIPANLNATQTDINYLIWCRAAHVRDTNQGTPGIHSSFIVPPCASFSSHFLNILAGIDYSSSAVLGQVPLPNPIPNAIRVSWKNTLDGMPSLPPPPHNCPTLATDDFSVNIHLDAVESGAATLWIGKVIKSHLGVSPLDFAVAKSKKWAKEGAGNDGERNSPYPLAEIENALPIGFGTAINGRTARNNLIGTLREVAITRAALDGAVPRGTFLPLLNGGDGIASASNPQLVKTVTICVTSNGVTELFPE